MKYLEFEPVVQEAMSFKSNSYLELRQFFVQWGGTICTILVEGTHMNNSMKLYRILVSGSGGDVILKISNLELWWPSCSVERYHLCKSEKGHNGEHSCEVI